MLIRNLIIFAVLLSLSVLSAAETWQIGANLRYRFESEGKDFNRDTRLNNFSLLRTRLHAQFRPTAGVYGFIQFQDARTQGMSFDPYNPFQFSLYQGYILLDSLWNFPFSLKLGRYEAVYGNERLIGAIGWSNFGQSFDGVTFKWLLPLGYIDLFNFKVEEQKRLGDERDTNFLGTWSRLNFGPNLNTDFFILWNRRIGPGEMSVLTVGGNTGFTIDDFQLTGEIAMQRGQSGRQQNIPLVGRGKDVEAFLLAFNGSYTFSQMPAKPGFTLGLDYLSGDDPSTDDVYEAFQTLYATNHKFYGMMDYFTNIPLHTISRGLMDVYLGLSSQSFEAFKFSLKGHLFQSARKFTLMDGSSSNTFGTELDLIIDYQYNTHAQFQGGAAIFLPGDIFKETRGKDDGLFFYVSSQFKL